MLTEAVFLLKREGRETDSLFALLERGVIRVAVHVEDEQADLRAPHAALPQPAHVAGGCMPRAAGGSFMRSQIFTLDAGIF